MADQEAHTVVVTFSRTNADLLARVDQLQTLADRGDKAAQAALDRIAAALMASLRS